MNEPVTVRYDLAEVLKRIEDKIDTNPKDLTDLKIGQARLEVKNRASQIRGKLNRNRRQVIRGY